MSKPTAVQWLIEKIEMQRENGNSDLRTTLHYCDKAEQMEKEQITDAYRRGFISDDIKLADEYYNETFGGGDERHK